MNGLKQIAIRSIQIYFVLGVILTPFQYYFFSWHTDLLRATLIPMLRGLADFLGLNPVLLDLSSDSILLLLLHVLIALIALITSLTLHFIPKTNSLIFKNLTHVFLSYFLSIILLKYGIDKLLSLQFPVPEPNLLLTPLGYLDRDILYWSVMGLGKGYVFFIGLAEIIPAVLLLFRRTRNIGAFLALIILLNVVAVNFGFDISVKLFSCFLCLMALYLSQPVLKALFNLFILNKGIEQKSEDIPLSLNSKKYFTLKLTASVFILLEALSPYYSAVFPIEPTDQQMTPTAFDVLSIEASINPHIKRVFFHSDNYLIIQDVEDNNASFPVYNYTKNGSTFLIRIDGTLHEVKLSKKNENHLFELNCTRISQKPLTLKKINHLSLPALQKNTHLTVDELIAQ
jgi:hypothetical protein